MLSDKDLLLNSITASMQLAQGVCANGFMTRGAYRFFLDTALKLVDQGYSFLGESRPSEVGVVRKESRGYSSLNKCPCSTSGGCSAP